jgi:hypothetical protein
MADTERHGAVCRRIRSIERRSCKEVVILGEFTIMSVLYQIWTSYVL